MTGLAVLVIAGLLLALFANITTRLRGEAADVTDRRQIEQSLRDADRRKDEFLATLAHELRNPLATIRSALEIMQRAAHDPRRVEAARDTARRQLEQLVRLVDDLLDVSRISTGKMTLKLERIDLRSVILAAADACRVTAEQYGQTFDIDVGDAPIWVNGDAVRLAQVFGNLISNACRYGAPGDRVTVRASAGRDGIVTSVRDRGIGIPKEKMNQIFGLFSQLDRSLEKTRGGLGIGLHLVKRLVEMHGGEVNRPCVDQSVH